MPKNCVIYARVSTSSQDEKGTSLESQIKECQNFAVQNGYIIKDTFSEIFSGAYLFERPILSQIRQSIKQKKYDVVVAYAIDRLSRDVAHLIIISNECERYDVELKFVSEDLDNSTEGKLLQSIRGYVAEIERQKIRERSLRGKHTKAQSGTLSFGHKVYGYTIENKQRIICEPEAETVKWLYTQMLAGRSMRSLATTLDFTGIPSPESGSCWSQSTVRRILRNPAYAGFTYAFRYKRVSKKRDGKTISYNVERDRSEWMLQNDSITPAIIDVETFESVQNIIAANKTQKRKRPTIQALLRGMIICGICGRTLTVNSAKYGYRGYVCDSRRSRLTVCGNRGISAKILDEYIWTEILKLLSHPSRFKAQLQKRQPKIERNSDSIKKSIDKISAEIERIVSRAGTASDEIWRMLEVQIKTKQSELDSLKVLYNDSIERERKKAESQMSSEKFREELFKNLPRLKDLDFDSKVKLLKSLKVKIIWIREIELSQIIVGILDN